MLEISNLANWIQSGKNWLRAVDDISFDIEAGEVFALIGESGSGKSMTALSIMRLLPPNARYVANSQIHLHGRNLIDLSEKVMRNVRGGDIGMIFQDPMTCLNPVLTIGSQITEVLTTHQRLKGRQCYVEALNLLDAVRIPAAVQRFNSYPHELSGGMKQRVMIAMALASKPSLLIADEPTTALDVTTQAQILNLLKEIQRQKNMAMLLITHDLAVAAQMADRIAVMRSGKIVEQNTRDKIFSAPEHAYSRQLLDCLPDLYAIKNRPINTDPQNILTVKNLQVYFPVKKGIFRKTVSQVKAVDGIDFNLIVGETLALVGESGCGKSSIAKAILGLIDEPVSGEVLYETKNLLGLSTKEWRKIRADIQIIFQDPFTSLNPKLRIVEILQESLSLTGKYKTRAAALIKIDELLTQVGLDPEYKWRFPHEFSGGERQRLCIARALSVEPKIIICDEPTSSLDVSVQAQILNLLKNLQREHKLTYLFISHDLSVVNYLADRIAVMYLGRIVETGLATEVLSNPKHPYTQTLLSAVPTINQKLQNTNAVPANEVPSPLAPPSGCHFHPRCKFVKPQCRKSYPETVQLSATHCVKCVLYKN